MVHSVLCWPKTYINGMLFDIIQVIHPNKNTGRCDTIVETMKISPVNPKVWKTTHRDS